MSNIDTCMWENRPRVPNATTQRICVIDRGGNYYKWDPPTSDWVLDSNPNTPALGATGQIGADVLPATVLASATIDLFKLTPGGTDGTVTIENGLVTGYTPPT